MHQKYARLFSQSAIISMLDERLAISLLEWKFKQYGKTRLGVLGYMRNPRDCGLCEKVRIKIRSLFSLTRYHC